MDLNVIISARLRTRDRCGLWLRGCWSRRRGRCRQRERHWSRRWDRNRQRNRNWDSPATGVIVARRVVFVITVSRWIGRIRRDLARPSTAIGRFWRIWRGKRRIAFEGCRKSGGWHIWIMQDDDWRDCAVIFIIFRSLVVRGGIVVIRCCFRSLIFIGRPGMVGGLVWTCWCIGTVGGRVG